METAGTRDWSYALIFLAVVSAFFLGLRVFGRAFVAFDFEIIIIYVPTVICLLIYVTKVGFGLLEVSDSHST